MKISELVGRSTGGELGIEVQVCSCGWQRKHVTGTDQFGEWSAP